jgi:hypothetical protein
MNLKRLPLEGGLLKELRVFGNGKRCYVRIETTEPEGEVNFLMMDPVIEIDLQGKARALVFNDGSDTELGFKVLPMEPLRAQRFVVDYPDTDSEWREVLTGIREGKQDPFGWSAEAIQLTLVSERIASEAVRGP